MYKLVVFDIDGTLLDTKYCTCKGLQNLLLQKTGKNHPMEDLDFVFGHDGIKTLEMFGLHASFLPDWVEEISKLSHTIRPFDGIIPMLDALFSKHFPMALASSKQRAEFCFSLEPLDMIKYFNPILCADDVEHCKPHPEPILKIANITGISTKDILFLGDTIYDFECAQSAGTDFALAGWSVSGELREKCSLCLEDPKELLTIL